MNKDMFNNKYRIKSTRFPDWDYHNVGYYFVTICTKDRQHYFGKIKNGEMFLSDIGKIAYQYRSDIPKHFPHISLDAFVIMPNHIHLIISINENIHENKINEIKNIASPKINDIKKYGDDFKETHDIKKYGDDFTYGDDFKETHDYASLPKKRTNQTNNNTNPNKFGPQIKNLGSIIRGFKSAVTTYAKIHTIEFARQPRYYENIIRTTDAHEKISKYIENNPKQWNNDEHYI